ncbi:MepB family protein [Pedobacter montanisoli]|uniref:MepB family protein n=1 Tax=Pedobacter montanisoli TaxID=2923277 RepID=A0ABS9ZZ63_9SPHI|nr:MepB family protein [Pedobacter montanisoli]MCJ0743590.1 MepB family protein [Pedobacter montanisoli]
MYNELKKIKEEFYDRCGLKLSDLKLNEERSTYNACSFKLNKWNIEYRLAKITPKKTGQFVAIWKRGKNGTTMPFDVSDDFDFMVITTIKGNKIGQFIVPKQVLKEKGIISQNGAGGKRGIRVYPPWDTTTNVQAQKSQDWQIKYFSIIEKSHTNTCLELLV